MRIKNEMRLDFPAAGKNESFARLAISAFVPVSYTHLDVYKRQRLMSVAELMQRYSDIRYAASMGYLHAPLRALDCLMMDMQPGSLGVRAGKLIGEREGEILRAKLMREQLLALVAN